MLPVGKKTTFFARKENWHDYRLRTKTKYCLCPTKMAKNGRKIWVLTTHRAAVKNISMNV